MFRCVFNAPPERGGETVIPARLPGDRGALRAESSSSRAGRRGGAGVVGLRGPGGRAIGSRPVDLADATLEDLMKIQITSASRKEQRADEVPAAVFVITQDDIRRSGLRTLPELFRLAPGVQVAQIDVEQLGGVDPRLQRPVLEQAAGAGRRTVDLQAGVLRRVLGCGGSRARGHRPHRSHPRPGRRGVGRQRGQRRHQHRHQVRARHAGTLVRVERRHVRSRRRPRCGTAVRFGSAAYRVYSQWTARGAPTGHG